MTKVATVTTADFDATVTDGKGLVLVDLWGPNCAPCRMIAPILDDLAQDFSGEVSICKIDVSAEPAIRDRLGVRGVPTLALFRDGAEVDRVVGGRSRSQLANWLEEHL